MINLIFNFLVVYYGFIAILIIIWALYSEAKSDAHMYKIMDESCYYCIYSVKPHCIRDSSKNTCKKINNQGWTSEQIRKCEYRVKE